MKGNHEHSNMFTLRQTYWKAVDQRTKLNANPDPAKRSLPVVMAMVGAESAQRNAGYIIKDFEKSIPSRVGQVVQTGFRNLYVHTSSVCVLFAEDLGVRVSCFV